MSIEEIYQLYLKYPTICTDTRADVENSLFFCLRGDNFNGNKFALDAEEKGAAAVFIDDKEYASPKTVLVENVLETLQKLASFHRKQFNFPVIGLTGSNGKTTTKELIASVLQQKYRTAFTRGNLNNHIGVPLTLLSVSADAEMAVIEMGANHRGEIKLLCEIADPDFGYITNIGKAHLEGFGSKEGIKLGKKELFDHLKKKNGKVFINSNDEVLMEISEGIERVQFGSGTSNFVSGKIEEIQPQLSFSWQYKEYESPVVKTQLVGGYNFTNIIAAACIGSYFDVAPEKVTQALEMYTPGNNRSQLVQTGKNLVIMDCYNANPSSMELALQNLSLVKGKKLALLGHMLELGDTSRVEHQRLVDLCTELELEAAFVGANFKGTEVGSYPYFESMSELQSWLQQFKPKGYTILLKGSRGIKMEQAREYI